MKTSLNCLLAGSISMLLMGGCVTKPPAPPPKPVPAPTTYWKGDGVKGSPYVLVDLSEQHVYFYKDRELVGESKCSSGKKSFRTPAGEYKITQKDKNHVSNLYGNFVDAEGTVTQKDVDMSKTPAPPEGNTFAGAKMPFYMRFKDGYGMHSGYVPNYPASHGCVRLPRHMAEHFFANVSVGTPVVVQE